MAEKVAFNTLKKLTVQDRLKVMKDSRTGALLTAALTPTDFANLFPRYYQMKDPDIGGFRAAVSQKTQSMQEKFSQAVADQLGIDPATGRRKGGWLEKMAEDYGPGGRKAPGGKDYVRPLSPLERAIKEQTGVDISAGPEQAELRGDQKKLFDDLKAGRVALDDPRAAMLKKMTPNQFAAAGLKIEDVDGKQYYKMAPVEVTEEEVKQRMIGGDKIEKVLDTIEGKESDGKNIKTRAKGQSASGYFQITDGTWKLYTKKYGIGEEYPTAMSAPYDVQRELARRAVKDIIRQNNGDISKVPLVWYTGNAHHPLNVIPHPEAGNKETAGEYQSRWMRRFERGGPVASTVDEARKLAQEDAEKKRQEAFAAATIEPPPGLSGKALEEFKKMPPGEQQRFSDAFYKMGGGESANKKVNESLQKSESATVEKPESTTKWNQVTPLSRRPTGYCARGVVDLSKQLFKGNPYFDNTPTVGSGVASAADVAHGRNRFFENSGMWKRGPTLGREQLTDEYLDSLPDGTIIAVGGGKIGRGGQGLGHIQMKVNGKWISDFPQQSGVLKHRSGNDYDNQFVVLELTQQGHQDLHKSGYFTGVAATDKAKTQPVQPPAPMPKPQTEENIPEEHVNPFPEEKEIQKEKKNVNVENTNLSTPPSNVPEEKNKPENIQEPNKDTTATVTKPEEKPKSEEKKPEGPKNVTFTLNKKAYLDEIERKHPAVNAPIVGPGRDGAWKQTLEGLDAEGIKYETLKNGDIKVTLPENDPRIARVRKDMKDNDLDEKLFLNSAPVSPVSDKSASVESNIQTTQTASVTKPEKSGMFDFVQTASASELDMSDPKVREAIKAQHERGIAARASTENITTPVSPSEKSAAAETTTEVKKPTGLSPNTKLIDYKSERTVSAVGATQEQYNAFREAVASIESSGGVYNKKGGAGGAYDGAYQFNKNAKKDAFRTMGGKIPSREDFRKDPLLQERAMDHYVTFNHRILMLKSEKYRNLSPEEKLKVLGYAHNQGAVGAAKWLETGKVRSDAFGTKGTKYSQTIGTHLTKLTETQKNFDQQQTQVAAVQQPVAPTPTPTPEPQKGYFESLKEKASAAVGFPTTAAAQPKPTSTPAAPEPSRKVDVPTPPHRPAEITPISQPEFPKTPKSEGPPTPPHRPAELTPQPGKPDETSTRSFLESQGIGKPEHIPVKATGGETETSTEVAAYPIGGLRGDNSVVVDTETQKPLFTMNTKTEAMVPDEENNKVNVVPTNKVNGGSIPAPAHQTSNSDFMSELNKLRDELTTKLDMAGETIKQNPIKGLDVGGDIDKDRTLLARMLSSTDNLYQTPSFKRAMMRSSAFKETDDFHGHYSQGTNGME